MAEETRPGVSLVADVGNSRVKWGLCTAGRIVASAALPPDAPLAWAEQLAAWTLPPGPLVWTVSGVHPQRQARLEAWLGQRGDRVQVVENYRQLPLQVKVEQPAQVGIDRLFNAVAAQHRRRPGVPAVVIDPGSAVTVDWLDEAGTFRGGAIFPGLRLMAQALRDYTALLPLVEVRTPQPTVPAPSTVAAIEAGIYWAVVGGIRALLDRLRQQTAHPPMVFLTGGDAALLAPALEGEVICWPEMTLEGIRLTAEARL